MRVRGRRPQWGPGQSLWSGVRGTKSPEADDIVLFHRQNYHINLGNLDYMASVRACLFEHRGWGTVPRFTYFYSCCRPRLTATACYLAKAGYRVICQNLHNT